MLPDIVTSAKGLSGAYLPLSVVGMREPIRKFFNDTPIGWGSTYAAHGVAMACAYECIKHMIKHDLVGNAARLRDGSRIRTQPNRNDLNPCGLGVLPLLCCAASTSCR